MDNFRVKKNNREEINLLNFFNLLFLIDKRNNPYIYENNSHLCVGKVRDYSKVNY